MNNKMVALNEMDLENVAGGSSDSDGGKKAAGTLAAVAVVTAIWVIYVNPIGRH